MAGFVEWATLAVKDKSTREIARINSELRKLNATARSLQSTFAALSSPRAGFGRAAADVGRYARNLERVRAAQRGAGRSMVPAPSEAAAGRLGRMATDSERYARNMQRAANAVDRINGARLPRTPGQQGGGVGGGGGRRGGSTRFGFGGRGMGLGIGGFSPVGGAGALAAYAGGRAALQETLALQGERSFQRTLGLTEDAMMQVAKAAEEAAKNNLSLTRASSTQAARELFTAGVTNQASLGRLTGAVAQGESSLVPLLGAAAARRATQSFIKGVDLAGALDDPQRAEQLFRGMFGAQLVGGVDFNTTQFLNALRTSQQAMYLSAEGLVSFGAVVDEQGRRAGERLQRFNTVLFNTNRIADKQAAKLQASGVLGLARANEEEFRKDFGAAIRKYIMPIVQGLGADLDNVTEVGKALRQIGFESQEYELVLAEIIQRGERTRNQALAAQVDYTQQIKNAGKDIGLASSYFAQQFKNLSSTILDPVAAAAAPFLLGLSQAMNEISRGEFSARSIGALAAGGAVAGVGLAARNPGVAALVLAGFRLRSAATALTRAAGALTGRGMVGNRRVPGAVPAVGAGGRRPGRWGRGLRGGALVGTAFAGFDIFDRMMQGQGFGQAVTAQLPTLVGGAIGGLVGSLLGPVGTAIGSSIGASIGSTMTADAAGIGTALGTSFSSVLPEAWRNINPPPWVSSLLKWAGADGKVGDLSTTPNFPTPRPAMPQDALGILTIHPRQNVDQLRELNLELLTTKRRLEELQSPDLMRGPATTEAMLEAQKRVEELTAAIQRLKQVGGETPVLGIPTPTPRPGAAPTANRLAALEQGQRSSWEIAGENASNRVAEAHEVGGDAASERVRLAHTEGASSAADAIVNGGQAFAGSLSTVFVEGAAEFARQVRAALATVPPIGVYPTVSAPVGADTGSTGVAEQ